VNELPNKNINKQLKNTRIIFHLNVTSGHFFQTKDREHPQNMLELDMAEKRWKGGRDNSHWPS
jgi:hypothetical protein